VTPIAPGQTLVVQGEKVSGDDLETFVGATLYVRLENVGFADASVCAIAESVLLSVEGGGQARNEIALSIDAPCLNPRARYVVRGLGDVNADGLVGVGDYASTASHTVSAGGNNTKLLHPVKGCPVKRR
jgi:hypothetical protein